MKKLIFIILILLSVFSFAQTKAFPAAHGAGRNATGGRGGAVLHVTTLADNGDNANPIVGSLRWALRQPYARYIVFDVSGQINIDATNYITLEGEHDDLTVAGQTAPEGGITISGNAIIYGGGYTATAQQPMDNHIWRYIRFRNASTAGTTRETGVILNNTSNWIFDHCSWSFCGNGALEMEGNAGDVLNGTVQRNIVSECGTGMILGNNDNGTWEIGNMTSMLNLWVDLSHRAPNIGGNFEQTGLQYDIVNNLHFNWKTFGTNIKSPGKPRVNHTGNYFHPGDYSWSYNYSNSGNIAYHYIGACQADNDTQIYSANNYHTIKFPQDVNDTRTLWRAVGGNGSDPNNPFTTLDNSYFVSSPFTTLDPTYTIQTPTAARADVLADVGANKYLNADGTFGVYLDDFDSTKINNVINGISSSPYDEASYGTQLSAIVANMPTNTRPANYYVSNPHIPEAYLDARQADLTAAGVTKTDANVHLTIMPSGYPLIEEFFNEVDGTVVNVPVTGITWNNDTQTIGTGETVDKPVTFSPSNATNRGVTYSSSNTGVLSDAGEWVSQGTATYTITTNDGNFTDDMAVTTSAGSTPVTGLTVSPSTATVAVGNTQQFTVTYDGSPTDQSGVWSSNNTNLATVNSYGLATVVTSSTNAVTNGGFDADTNWIKQDPAWTISSGVASCDGSQTNARSIYQDAGIVVDKAYSITITMSNRSAGGVKLYAGGELSGDLITTNGTHTQILHPDFVFDSNVWIQADADFIGDIDDVIVAEMPVITYTSNNGGYQDTGIIIVPIVGQSTPTTPPTTPSNASITDIGNTTATVSWSPSVSSNGVLGYYIRDTSANIIANVTGGTVYNFSGLTKNTPYNFNITAYDTDFNESAALGIGFTTANILETTPNTGGLNNTIKFRLIHN